MLKRRLSSNGGSPKYALARSGSFHSSHSLDDAPMSASQPQTHPNEEEKTMTVTDIYDSEPLVLQGKSTSNEQSLSDQTFNKKKDSSEETNQKRDKSHKKKNHLMSLKNERILLDISQNDEKILRHLFKKFTNSWSLFQKHSKLQGKYSV